MKLSPELRKKFSKIELVILDVDGVLTDGTVAMSKYGDNIYFFNVRDGAGIHALTICNIRVALVSGRKSSVITRRAKVFGITDIYQEVADKSPVLDKLLKKYSLIAEQVCYVGDDIIDLGILKRVGLPVAVGDATDEVKKISKYITTAIGGKGAVREVAELILKSKKMWKKVLDKFSG
ncbi:MAG: HAD hydrolase family protein [Planctomycetota bacterium]